MLRHLIDTGRYFNDVRTLILVHDRRVLAVLVGRCDPPDLLGADEAEELRAFLIPSWTITEAGWPQSAVRARRGHDREAEQRRSRIDALVRRECGEAAWRAARRPARLAEDMYQHYLPQRRFRRARRRPRDASDRVAAQRDATSYGPGGIPRFPARR